MGKSIGRETFVWLTGFGPHALALERGGGPKQGLHNMTRSGTFELGTARHEGVCAGRRWGRNDVMRRLEDTPHPT